tara:strand:- start:3729 stop:3905 length:177 start_codon:yes stop_codon:yes gene_type:complete
MTTDLDTKISFISGYVLTVFAAASFMDLLMAAGVGLIGGACGLLGKDLYRWLKAKLIK